MAEGDFVTIHVDFPLTYDCGQVTAHADQSATRAMDLVHHDSSRQMAARYVRSPSPLPDSLNNEMVFRYDVTR